MKKLLALLTLAVAAVATVQAQGFDFGALQKQIAPLAQQAAGNPAMQQVQQQMMQQALLEASKNPQIISQMANSLSPSQQSSLMQQALVIGQKLFTPAEQAKLASFTSSPEGASIAAKMPQLVQQMAPTVLQMYAASMGGATTAPAAGK